VAETPHKKVAVAMYRYPRSGCGLVDKELVQTFRIKPNYHFIIDNGGGGGTAVVFVYQVTHRHRVSLDVTFFVLDAPSREVGL
jgi:hypothetical protein